MTLTTDRLVLRPFRMSDAPRVRELAGEWDVARTTANVPHPYGEGVAETWIAAQDREEASATRRSVTFAVDLKQEGVLIGAIGLDLHLSHEWAELGYWIGKPYWNRGYCTEAARELLRYGFVTLGLNRIQARYMAANAASGRVMEKIGMTREGVLRQSLKRFDVIHDAVMFSILKQEYQGTL